MAENKINKPEQEEEKKKKSLAVWWKGLNKGVRTTICILGGAAVATAVVVPTVIAAKKCSGSKERVPQIDSSITNVTCTYKLVDGNMEITLTCSDATKEIADIESITIGNTILVKGTDYTYDASSQKIVIKKATLDKDSGTIIVKPLVNPKYNWDLYFKFTKIEETETCKIEAKSDAPEMPNPLYIPSNVTIDGKKYSVVEMDSFSAGTFSADSIIVLPSTMKKICTGCFESSDQTIKKIVLNDGLEDIGMSAFDAMPGFSLEEINIPSSIINYGGIGYGDVFYNCYKLKTVILDKQSFADDTEGCKGLLNYSKNIYIKDGLNEPGSNSYIKKEGFIKQDTSDKPGYSKWSVGKNKFKFKTIDESSCSVAPNLHSEYDDTVTISETDGSGHNVTTIESNAFEGSIFNTLIMPSTLTTIKSGGFFNCNIKKIKLNDGLTDIGDSAFNKINGLEEINIPSSITTLHQGSSSAFCNCSSLKTVVIDSQAIASATNSLVHGDVYSFAETVYIKDNLTDPTIGQHVFNNYNKQATSDRLGYNKWTKK